jgi:uncharacterized protein involved in exopolysaccharide biosynthesis
VPTRGFADEAHDQAIQSLKSFLFNATERRAFANQNPKAQEANNYLESLPSWAQQEILEIIMEVMKQEGENASRYGNIAATSGAEAAGQQLSPALRARVAALAKRLKSDPHFTSKEKMKGMKQSMPLK